ncbi:alpha/beta fold hydrolase [Tateyamaria sp. SN6-1]|uniref:alpha/beta fold hydrolase n=1 Tax=Tateyamaria sp. SN6-1 TaxID=3092148 RepID=UPI0039F46A51
MYIEVNGIDMFFDVVGPQLAPDGDRLAQRRTLLVLHGGPGYDHLTLRPYFDRFADQYQVVYVDHRGCGRTHAPRDTWRLDQWADDIDAFCTALRIERPIVLGQSFGGMVAMHYAARHPQGPERLVLSSTAARFLLDETVAFATRLGGAHAGQVARDFFSTPTVDGYKTYAEVVLPLYNRNPGAPDASFRDWAIERPEVSAHFFAHEMMGMDLRPGLAAITCPTLVLGGAEDPVTPPQCSTDIADAIGGNATLTIVPDAGHGVFRDDPDGAEDMLRAFFAGAASA